MKRVILIISIMAMLFSLSGCSNESSEEETPNPILGKIYTHNTPLEHTFDFSFVKFYDDNTFQGIKTSFTKNYITGEMEPNRVNYYGVYEINKGALTLFISNDSFYGVILDDGDTIRFGSDEFVDWTENIGSDDPLLSAFRQ